MSARFYAKPAQRFAIELTPAAADGSFYSSFARLPARGGVVVAAAVVHLDSLGTNKKGDTLVLAGILDGSSRNDQETALIFFNEYIMDGWTPHWHGWFPFRGDDQEAYLAVATSLASQKFRLNLMVIPND